MSLIRVTEQEYKAWIEAAGDKLQVDTLAPENMTVHTLNGHNAAFMVEEEGGTIVYNTLTTPAEKLGESRAYIMGLLK
jgi:hypothetical protein